MTIEQINKIDIVSVDDKNSKIILSISDHLEWNIKNHLFLLQDKINTYLRFIESGEIWEHYPKQSQYTTEIETISKYPFTSEATNFLEQVKTVVEGAGIGFSYKVYEE